MAQEVNEQYIEERKQALRKAQEQGYVPEDTDDSIEDTMPPWEIYQLIKSAPQLARMGAKGIKSLLRSGKSAFSKLSKHPSFATNADEVVQITRVPAGGRVKTASPSKFSRMDNELETIDELYPTIKSNIQGNPTGTDPVGNTVDELYDAIRRARDSAKNLDKHPTFGK